MNDFVIGQFHLYRQYLSITSSDKFNNKWHQHRYHVLLLSATHSSNTLISYYDSSQISPLLFI